MRQVLLYQDEDGVWIAEVLSLPGCGSDGETREQALQNVKEAIQLYIESLIEDGLPLPEAVYNQLEVVSLEVDCVQDHERGHS